MNAGELLRSGRLDESVSHVEDQVRREPQVAKHRVLLFQLLALAGKWERAFAQLRVSGELEPTSETMVRTYREALRSEAVRAEVFAGRRTPIVMGEPSVWIAQLTQALQLEGEGQAAQANDLRAQALEAAPATAGEIEVAQQPAQRFAWLGDADPRLGPVLEVIVNGRYVWLPFVRVREVRFEAPSDVRDFVWTPATITLETEGEVPALIPARYPGTPEDSDALVRLARKTVWGGGDGVAGRPLGQRMLVTDLGDAPLFDVRRISFDVAADVASQGAVTEAPGG